MKVAFIGVGVMGEAMIAALLRQRTTSPGKVYAYDIDQARLKAIEKKYKVNCTSDIAKAVGNCDVVVLSIKPQVLAKVMNNLKGALKEGQLVLSIVAGASTETISKGLKHDPVIRVMPNTPALIGKGVTGIAAGSRSTPAQLAQAHELFSVVGWVFELPESQIDALSTISGSGPAYVFHAMEQWTRAAVELGFAEEDARNLVEKTFAGATALQESTGVDPAELRRRVTSPNGTTERAIAVLDDAHLAEIYRAAAEAALARARELARELGL